MNNKYCILLIAFFLIASCGSKVPEQKNNSLWTSESSITSPENSQDTSGSNLAPDEEGIDRQDNMDILPAPAPDDTQWEDSSPQLAPWIEVEPEQQGEEIPVPPAEKDSVEANEDTQNNDTLTPNEEISSEEETSTN